MALACVACMWSVEGLGRGGRRRENVSLIADFEPVISRCCSVLRGFTSACREKDRVDLVPQDGAFGILR